MKYAEVCRFYKQAAAEALANVPTQPSMEDATQRARDAVKRLPSADQVREAGQQAKRNIQPVFDDLKEKYQPLIDDAKAWGNDKINWGLDKLKQLNSANTGINAASIGAGGLTAMGTYGLTGLIPGLKKSLGLRLLLSAMTGGIAGTYAKGGLTGAAIDKARPAQG